MNNIDDDMRGIANGTANFCMDLFGGIADVINRHNQIKSAKIDYFVRINNANLDFVNNFFAREGLGICRRWETFPWMVTFLIKAISTIDDAILQGKEPEDAKEKYKWKDRIEKGGRILLTGKHYIDGSELDYEEFCMQLSKIFYESSDLRELINKGVSYHGNMLGYYKKIHAQQDGQKLLAFFKLIEDDFKTRKKDCGRNEPYINVFIHIIRHCALVHSQQTEDGDIGLKEDQLFLDIAEAFRSDDDSWIGDALVNVFIKYYPDAARNYGWDF